MKPRHRKLAQRCQSLLEPGEQVRFVFGGQVDTGHPALGITGLGILVLLAASDVPWWVAAPVAAAVVLSLLLLGSEWRTVAVTDRSIVVLRNSNRRLERTPVEVVERLPHSAWRRVDGRLEILGGCFRVVPTDREQLLAADSALSGTDGPDA